MPVINDVIQGSIDWIKGQQLSPIPREVSSVGALPPAAYPQVVVMVDSERFEPGTSATTAEIVIRVSYALGRPADAVTTVRDLAHQLRRALISSHGMGGLVKSLKITGIRHDVQLSESSESLVVARAELLVRVKYFEPPL